MRQKHFTNSLLLLGLVVLTACPNNESRNNAPPVVVQQQNPPGPTNPSNPNNPFPNNPLQSNIKSFQCSLEAYRTKQSKFLGLHFNKNTSITPTVYVFPVVDNGIEYKTYLRSIFLGIDIGNFGNITMKYVPAVKTKSKTDTIILSDSRLNEKINMSQSGFAGSDVKLEAYGDDMSLVVSCKGIVSQFKSGTTSTKKTNLICRGTSHTATSELEEVDMTIPLSELLNGEEHAISSAVGIQLDKDAANITYTGALDLEDDVKVISTASLKSPASFTLADKKASAKIDITCAVE